ncbi:Helitron helicase [Phytophthora megakarya]|uniref:Helitron helicase n=1 Tax=Phytophthora megakarya TaxID=4795 RepID=A0A225VF12_9STRA|nr:Helitron helicase [Phytophthora megakarya]
MNARRLLIESTGPEYQAAVEEFARRDRAGGTKLEPQYSQYPTASEVAGIIIDGGAVEYRDILLHCWQGGLERIFETKASYDPLQYHLLLPYGEPGWTLDLPYAGNSDNPNIGAVSLREYESYLLHDRTDSDSLILKAVRLTQQYCVDQWAKCEQSRLRYIDKNQLLYRLETLQGLSDVLRNESSNVHRGAVNEEVAQRSSTGRSNHSRERGVAAAEPESSNLGHKVKIPPTFTRDPRYMYQRFSDAMALVRETCVPNLSITMACNPNLPEIKENLRRGEQASDRPDLVVRVFMQELKAINQDLDEGVLGGKVHVMEY